jgi:hypothetical protein
MKRSGCIIDVVLNGSSNYFLPDDRCVLTLSFTGQKPVLAGGQD